MSGHVRVCPYTCECHESVCKSVMCKRLCKNMSVSV